MITRADVDDAAKEAFAEAFKDRFSKISTNETTLGADEGEREMRLMLTNLKAVHEQACKIINELWPP